MKEATDKSRLVKHNYIPVGGVRGVERNAFNLWFMHGKKLSRGEKNSS